MVFHKKLKTLTISWFHNLGFKWLKVKYLINDDTFDKVMLNNESGIT